MLSRSFEGSYISSVIVLAGLSSIVKLLLDSRSNAEARRACGGVEETTDTSENTGLAEREYTLSVDALRVARSTSALTQLSDRRESDRTSDIVADGATIACAHDVAEK